MHNAIILKNSFPIITILRSLQAFQLSLVLLILFNSLKKFLPLIRSYLNGGVRTLFSSTSWD